MTKREFLDVLKLLCLAVMFLIAAVLVVILTSVVISTSESPAQSKAVISETTSEAAAQLLAIGKLPIPIVVPKDMPIFLTVNSTYALVFPIDAPVDKVLAKSDTLVQVQLKTGFYPQICWVKAKELKINIEYREWMLWVSIIIALVLLSGIYYVLDERKSRKKRKVKVRCRGS